MTTQRPTGEDYTLLTKEEGILLVNLTTGEEQELQQTATGLSCDCFWASAAADGHCPHIEIATALLEGETSKPELQQADADTYLARIAALDATQAANAESARIQTSRIETWLEVETEKLDRRRAFYLHALHSWLVLQGQRSKRLVNGRIALRKQQPQIEILDEEAVVADTRFQRVVPQQVLPDRRALREHILKTGEEVQGTRVTLPEPKLYYRIAKGG